MSTRVCAKPGCPKFTDGERFCPAHTPESGWKRRPSRAKGLRTEDDRKRRSNILRRDKGVCYVCSEPGADEVDHVVPLWKFKAGLASGSPDAPTNLKAIHADPCHKRKTRMESQEAKNFYARLRRITG
jgi:5-methylcytosine-specific restriction endonuclease McrA